MSGRLAVIVYVGAGFILSPPSPLPLRRTFMRALLRGRPVRVANTLTPS